MSRPLDFGGFSFFTFEEFSGTESSVSDGKVSGFVSSGV
jgi:hypothetical protein